MQKPYSYLHNIIRGSCPMPPLAVLVGEWGLSSLLLALLSRLMEMISHICIGVFLNMHDTLSSAGWKEKEGKKDSGSHKVFFYLGLLFWYCCIQTHTAVHVIHMQRHKLESTSYHVLSFALFFFFFF